MKKFLIIVPINVFGYKDTFPLLKNNEVSATMSKTTNTSSMYFIKNNSEKVKIPASWLTSIDSRHLNRKIELKKTYSPDLYPKYDNFDAINVDKIDDIPKDYKGLMGVPITILLFSNDEIEIVDKLNSGYVNGKEKYKRIIIKLKNSE